MWWEMLLGILVITALTVLMGPAFWSSSLSLSERQKQKEKENEQRRQSEK
jgi:hypothetical protein